MRIMFLGRSGAGKTSMIAHGFAELATCLRLRVALLDRQQLGRARRAVERGRRPARTRRVPTYRGLLPGETRVDCTDHDGRVAGLTVPVMASGTARNCALPLLWCLRHGRPDPAVETALAATWPSGPHAAWPWRGARRHSAGAAP